MAYYINILDELIKSGSFYWFCALTGTGIILIQFILNILGVADQDSFDLGDAASDTIHDASQDNVDARRFKWLSMQTVSGFLMMFGWTAITCHSQFGLMTTATIGISLSVGALAAFIIRTIFRLAKKLRSSGSIFRIENAIGKEGYIYQAIPKGGMGKVSVSLHDFTHEINATSHHPEDLSSFVRVKIVEKSDDHTVVVAPL
ncbi:MAG: hypothetical protein Q8K75_07210 [Chlamydiales bacterium]|nr:hypothetical protein [Chlamydiales bacterium]